MGWCSVQRQAVVGSFPRLHRGEINNRRTRAPSFPNESGLALLRQDTDVVFPLRVVHIPAPGGSQQFVFNDHVK